jgi:DNA end-binding protein Ku
VAPRAYWKGYLKLSLVSCPISLFPATSDREKISFHQLHKQTGNRIKYKKVDSADYRIAPIVVELHFSLLAKLM